MLEDIILPADPELIEDFEMTEELKSYKADLEEAYDTCNDAFFPNHKKEYAALVLSTIFSKAKDHVYIYGKGLRQEISSCRVYFNALKDCIIRGIKVFVLLDDNDLPKSDVRKWIEDIKSDTVQVKSIKNVSEEMEKYVMGGAHFTVADGRMFRLEYDIENFKAFVGFHHKDAAENLEDKFMKVFNQA